MINLSRMLEGRKAPKRLGRDPIVEAVAEFRFQGVQGTGTASLLAGALFSKLKREFPQFEPLPPSQIPAQVLEVSPELRYVPLFRMTGGRFGVLVGNHALSVFVTRPYPGWEAFRNRVQAIWSEAGTSGLIQAIERVSIKYVNILEAPPQANHLALTTLSLTVSDQSLSTEPVTVRMELPHEGTLTTINVVSQAKVMLSNREAELGGLVLDVDTILKSPEGDFWRSFPSLLDQLHDIEKAFFYGCLREETIRQYQPEY